MTLSPTEQATVDAHFQHQADAPMLIPNVIAALTSQLNEAWLQRDVAITQLAQAEHALQAMQGDHQVLWAELRAANLRLLLADQQNANEPDPPVPVVIPAPTPTTTARVMPATALRQSKQAIGLLW